MTEFPTAALCTTWTSMPDDPLLSKIALGDLLLDPNDHNTIYAGTGDLRYGSFSFGAAGLLGKEDRDGFFEGIETEIGPSAVALHAVEKGRDINEFAAGVHEMEVQNVLLVGHEWTITV